MKVLCKTVLPSRFKMIIRHRMFYLMLLPGICYFIVFKYFPMYGITIAFRDYNIIKGLSASPWCGLKYFMQAFESPFFLQVLSNTITISLYKIVFGFPAPIILALLLNEVKNQRFKRITQTISYLPHFISWVVLGGILIDLLSPSGGAVNNLLNFFGADSIYFLGSKDHFRSVLVISDIYKQIGWNSIIYLAALSSIDPALYEAAIIDGANRFQCMWFITIPSIMSTVSVMLILRVGSILNVGFEQIFVLYNEHVLEVGDVIDTWVYRTGINNSQYSLATAVGLFQSVIGLVFVVTTNYLSRKLGSSSIW